MTTPSFLEGVLVAVVASIGGSVVETSAVVLLGSGHPRLLVASLALGYVLYLLRRSPARVGRVTALAAWGLGASLLWLAVPSLTLYVLLHVGAIWLLRSLFFHAGPFTAIADLGLSGLALVAGLWAYVHTGSLLLSLWSFFLLQASFVAIPQHGQTRASAAARPRHDRFELAHQAAETAVRRLTSIR